jgi:hypothetical protein
MPKKKISPPSPKHQKTIEKISPQLADAVHTVLKSHGIDAVVHSISFRKSGAITADCLNGGCPDGAQCCMINGTWTCFPNSQ